jgi:hypothetical protein
LGVSGFFYIADHQVALVIAHFFHRIIVDTLAPEGGETPEDHPTSQERKKTAITQRGIFGVHHVILMKAVHRRLGNG